MRTQRQDQGRTATANRKHANESSQQAQQPAESMPTSAATQVQPLLEQPSRAAATESSQQGAAAGNGAANRRQSSSSRTRTCLSCLLGSLLVVEQLHQPGEGGQQGGPSVGGAHRRQIALADLERVLEPLVQLRYLRYQVVQWRRYNDGGSRSVMQPCRAIHGPPETLNAAPLTLLLHQPAVQRPAALSATPCRTRHQDGCTGKQPAS